MNLYFSEYLENAGSAGDAIEIYNAGSTSVNLANCRVRVYTDASTTNPGSVMLSGTLTPGSVYVLCGDGANGVSCNQTNGGLTVSGNDPVTLECTVNATNTTLDVIGQVGGSPAGGQWGDASLGTADQSIRRGCSVAAGDANGTDAFAPATEWSGTGAVVTSGFGSRGCPSAKVITESATPSLWARLRAWFTALLD